MRYSIGDVARTLGLTPAALHFFEKEGVIQPVKGSNTHRTYGADDIVRLISYRKYRSMEFPLKEIAQQFSSAGSTYPEIAAKLAASRLDALAAAERATRLAEQIDWFERHIRASEHRMAKIDVQPMPACCLLTVGEDGYISRNRTEQQLVASWLEQLPAVRLGSVLDGQNKARLGFSVDVKTAERLNLRGEATAETEAGVALHTFLRIPNGYYNEPMKAFRPLLDYAAAHGFARQGMGMAVNLCVWCHEKEHDTLVEVWLPIA